MPRKKSQAKSTSTPVVGAHLFSLLREGVLIVIITFSLFLFLSLLTYHQTDPGWSNLISLSHVRNAGGMVGAYLADFFLSLLGYWAFILPLLLSYMVWFFYRHRHQAKVELPFGLLSLATKMVGFLLVMLTGTAIAALCWSHEVSRLPYHAGGILGSVIENFIGF